MTAKFKRHTTPTKEEVHLMSRIRIGLATMAVVAAPALASCGEEKEAGRAQTSSTPAATAAATRSALPEALAGAWRITLERSELPADDRQARGENANDFELEFNATGGTDDGPSMTIGNEARGTFVMPISVSADEIVIDEFGDCRKVTYTVEGDRLAMESPEACRRKHTLHAILGTRPLRRAQ